MSLLMNLNIQTLSFFEKDVKRLFKKYKQLPNDLRKLKQELLNNPKAGVELGNSCYKIRLANSSVPTGKSGGFRIIYYYLDSNDNLYLMAIYSKSELANIDEKVLVHILKEVGL